MATTETVWSGQEALRDLLVPVDEIGTHPDNPRRGNVDAIAASLERFGQVRPIIVNKETSYIVAGNHTYRAAVKKGWNRIAAVVVDLTPEEEKAYLVADNRTADLGEYDGPTLIRVLADLAETGKLDGTGYTTDNLEDMIAEQEAIAQSARNDFEPSDEDPPRLDKRTNPGVFEVVLLLDDDQRHDFANHVKVLKREWSLETAPAVCRAVREIAAAM